MGVEIRRQLWKVETELISSGLEEVPYPLPQTISLPNHLVYLFIYFYCKPWSHYVALSVLDFIMGLKVYTTVCSLFIS